MLGQVRLLAEALAALGASVGARVRVNAFVLQQGALLLEILAAGQALEQTEVRVFGLFRTWGGGLVHLVARQQVGHCIRLKAGSTLIQSTAATHSGQNSWLIQVVKWRKSRWSH